MYVTFRNNSNESAMLLSVGNQNYTINPESSVDVFCPNPNVVFEAQSKSMQVLTDMIKELDEEIDSYKLKDRILAKLTKKFAQTVTEIALEVSVKYEVSFKDCESATVNLYEGINTVCDGRLADILDLTPLAFYFSRAEADNGEIKAVDAHATNRKKFMKVMRNILLFLHWGIIFLDLFFFIPEYSIVKFFSSDFYLKRFFINLYNKPESKRAAILQKKEQSLDEEDKKKGCFGGIIKILVVLLIIGGLLYWGTATDPYVIISKDFSSVECFDEVFVKIDGGLPSDAEEVFLEDYNAYYPLADGEYDMDNFYCYIYETPDGTRYMWLKDNCAVEGSDEKDYEDYPNPKVYKSVGVKEE